MLKIANPLYDSVFKHLMENQEVASGLISTLLGVEILELTPQPQEITDNEITENQVARLGVDEGWLRVFRIDFSALVRLADGTEPAC